MDQARLRAWWWQKQGLDGRLLGEAPAVALAETGWARSVGGANPYLTLFARAGVRRPAVDEAVRRLEIHELPSARGCTYVLPAKDFALGLKAAELMGEPSDLKTARKFGVTDKEIEKLCHAVMDALAAGPMGPDELRAAAGGAVRNFGPEGVRKGLTTSMPVALDMLQASGEIRRVPTNGRLDQQRYQYVLWRPNPLEGFRMTPQEVAVELARRYFKWIGPASVAEFQWFSGLGSKTARAAMEPLGLVPLAAGDERLMLPADREKFASFHTPTQPQFSLVSSLDGISLLRRDLAGMLEPKDLKREVMAGRGCCAASDLKDLPSHGIVDRGRLVGLWEYDPDSSVIVWMSFIPRNKELENAVKRMEEFIVRDLGDARSFSLDSPKSRQPRLTYLRRAAGA